MKKLWDFLLLLVSGLLVFVAIITVVMLLTREDEPPAKADSGSVHAETAVASSAAASVPVAGGTVPDAVRHTEPAQGTRSSAPNAPNAPASSAPSTSSASSAQLPDQPQHQQSVPAAQQLMEQYDAMAARERALRQAEERMAQAHARLEQWFSLNRKAVLDDLEYLRDKGRYEELYARAGLFESLDDSEVQRYRKVAAEKLQKIAGVDEPVVAGHSSPGTDKKGSGRANTLSGTAGSNADGKSPTNDAVAWARAEKAHAVGQRKARIREQLKGLRRWHCAGPKYAAMTWYHDSEGVQCSAGSRFFLLVGMQEGQKPVLMLRVQYDGPNALPIRSFEVELIRTVEVPAGIGAESGEQGGVVWWAKPVGKREAQLVLDVIDRSRSTLRIGGQKGWIEREISAEERASLRRMLTFYEAALSSHEEQVRLEKADAGAVGTGAAD